MNITPSMIETARRYLAKNGLRPEQIEFEAEQRRREESKTANKIAQSQTRAEAKERRESA